MENLNLDIHTTHTGQFKTLIEVLKDMIPEANIEFINNTEKKKNTKGSNKKLESNGLKIMAMDTTQTVLIYLKLDAKSFQTFKCATERYRIGVNLGHLYKLIKSMDKEDDMRLQVKNDDVNTLQIIINNQDKHKLDDSQLKLLDLPDDKITIPPVDFDVIITIDGSEFHRLCREMGSFAEYIEIKAIEDKAIFTCKGEYATKSTKYSVNNNENVKGNTVHIKPTQKLEGKKFIIQGIFELDKLILFGKCANLTDKIEIYLKNNWPLVIVYTIGEQSRISLCLTPINVGKMKDSEYAEDDENEDDDENEE
jgi:proliferating cell nuclear antigen